MPQLVEEGKARQKIFQWLNKNPKASAKDLRQEFKIKRRTLYDYYSQWQIRHSHDQVKKDIIYLLRFMILKMVPKGQITLTEQESIHDIELRVRAIEDDMGIIRKTDDDILEPLHLKRRS